MPIPQTLAALPIRMAGLAASVLLLLVFAGGGAAPEALAGPGKRALDEFFKGTVVSIEDDVVTLRYDFNDKEQAKDFEDRIPWPITRRNEQGIKWFDEKLEVVGNATARHVAEWSGEVLVTATATPDTDKDIGGYLTPINGSNDFATFTLTETFFHKWDGSPGGTHSIIKFGNQWRESGSTDDFIGFRYVDRKPPKEKISPGTPVPITFGIQKKYLVMTAPNMELKGKDRGKKLKTFFLGLYAIKGRALFDNIEIVGTLNDEWVRHENLELRIANPDTATAGELDRATKEWIAALGDGKSSKPARELLKIVADTGRPRPYREAVIEALSTGPKKTVKYVLDLLYAPEEEVRDDAICIVKALMGKDWGYKAGGKESSRSKAIQKMNDELRENPSLLEG